MFGKNGNKNIDNITVTYIPETYGQGFFTGKGSKIEIKLPYIVNNFDSNQVAVQLTQTSPTVPNITLQGAFRPEVIKGAVTEYYTIDDATGTITITYAYSLSPLIRTGNTRDRPPNVKFTFGILCSA